MLLVVALLATACATPRGTGDLGLVVERADGSVVVVNTTERDRIAEVDGLGDLSHASVVYSRDQRYAYVFGRDGGLTKVDLLRAGIARRVVQSGNSIGGAISQDGSLVAVSNYEPGGVKVFDAVTLEPVADIPATRLESGGRSKVVGLVDAPGQRFVFSLFDSNEIWIADFSEPDQPDIQKIRDIGAQPYDALITPDGRYYIAGLFGEDGLALVDLWHPENGATRILDGYGRGEEEMPVYKMPHLEGWAVADKYAFVPAVGHAQVLVVDRDTWQEAGRIDVHGQPVFVMARPDQRQVWVNFAHPRNDTVQVIDVASLEVAHTLKPGKSVMHMEFTPRGEHVWISVRDENRVRVYDTRTLEPLAVIPAQAPSGIFFTSRAHRTGL
ncbi:MAG TPA: cytochrome D1 domain-containing protein [Arenicellales bacterium]|nr:cytochrome D1 domain-containing protein [Arenicellales bacterium]